MQRILRELCGINPSAAGLAFIAHLSAELTCKCQRERSVSHDLILREGATDSKVMKRG